ncbi:AT hook containing transcription factor 1 homolog [Dermatophagoides pteronyssinus]|uniref:AT hook containing transcription factor 1 homolog n=1 Tax=Dermatophagoides pteronyssinus TaxID=6956 RepID=UPI003F67D254
MDTIFDSNQISNITNIQNITTSLNGRKNTLYFSTPSNYLSAKYVWNIINSRLEVYSFEPKCNNRLVASFDFGHIFNDSNILITNVIRLADRFEVASNFRHPYKLITILSLTNGQNYICLLDIRLNSILNTIDFPFNITFAEVILSGHKNDVENMPLINELCFMNGCLAIGCEGGLVFFIDLILDSYSPEPLIPKKISIITPNSAHMDINNKRRTAIFHNQVLCITLNTEAKNKGKFNYRADDGVIMASYLQSQVYVSALHYIPQLSLICVGYNFGGFHLYNLQTFKLECSCNVDPELLPVISFSFQSPENDPKNYSYLWVVRGFPYRVPNVYGTHSPIGLSTAFIYLLCYQNRKTLKNYGILYDTFKLCCCKFEMPLTSNYSEKNNLNKIHLANSSRLIDMFTIHQIQPISKSIEEETMNNPIDYNYLVIAWEASTGKNQESSFYFCLFDLNQWYKSQMTKSFCIDQNDLCPFISLYSLNTLSKMFRHNIIQAIYLPSISISKFSSNMFYSEIHSYPVSVSFNLIVASDSQLCNISFHGIQKRLLTSLNSSNSSLQDIKNNCHDIVAKCHKYGLIFGEYSSTDDLSSETNTKLFEIMNVALENNLNFLLMNFIRKNSFHTDDSDWMFLLDWIWTKVESIKSSIDILVAPLFDLSGTNVSRHDIAKLVCYESHLEILIVLLKQLLQNSTNNSNLGFDKLRARIEIVSLIQNYLKFILFFENFGFLPECKDSEDIVDKNRPKYSYSKTSEFYCKRRADLMAVNKNFFKSKHILLIDILVKHLEPHIGSIWNVKDHKNLYPPQNLSSLCKIFLLDDVPLVYKESILFYFFYDLCDNLGEHGIAQKLSGLISTIDIEQGIQYFVEGLWFLDHQQYDRAVQSFTHPVVTTSLNHFKIHIVLFNDLMQRIIELFLFEDQPQKALTLTMNCNHILLDQEQNENLYIQILLLNGNLSDAFEFQRQRRSDSNSYHLLYKLFFVCEKMNTLVKICRIPLDNFEEEVFIEYLINSNHSTSKMILVLYFILNNKLIEAINIVKQFEQEFHFEEENKNILNLIDAYVTILPSSTLDLAKQILRINKSNKINEIQPESNMITNQSITLTPTRMKDDYSKNPIYLSPGFSKSKILKTKNQNNIRKLFTILRTPDMKRKITDSVNNSYRFDLSVTKKPILKFSNDSNIDNETGHSKLKVSFSNELEFSENIEIFNNEQLANPIESNTKKIKTIEEITLSSTPTSRRSKITRKQTIATDSPTHRMTLRNRKN